MDPFTKNPFAPDPLWVWGWFFVNLIIFGASALISSHAGWLIIGLISWLISFIFAPTKGDPTRRP